MAFASCAITPPPPPPPPPPPIWCVLRCGASCCAFLLSSLKVQSFTISQVQIDQTCSRLRSAPAGGVYAPPPPPLSVPSFVSPNGHNHSSGGRGDGPAGGGRGGGGRGGATAGVRGHTQDRGKRAREGEGAGASSGGRSAAAQRLAVGTLPPGSMRPQDLPHRSPHGPSSPSMELMMDGFGVDFTGVQSSWDEPQPVSAVPFLGPTAAAQGFADSRQQERGRGGRGQERGRGKPKAARPQPGLGTGGLGTGGLGAGGLGAGAEEKIRSVRSTASKIMAKNLASSMSVKVNASPLPSPSSVSLSALLLSLSHARANLLVHLLSPSPWSAAAKRCCGVCKDIRTYFARFGTITDLKFSYSGEAF